MPSAPDNLPLPQPRSSWYGSVPWLSAIVVVAVLVLLFSYWSRTRLPARVVIAAGPEDGRYAQLAEGIAEELQLRMGIPVDVRETQGSLENLQLLEAHEVHLGLYQPGTRLILEGNEQSDSGGEPAKFVSNLYSEFLLPIGAAEDKVGLLAEPDDVVWSCNHRLSGEYAAAKLLLDHLNINEADINVQSVRYVDLPGQVRGGHVNVGILCCGLSAPVLPTLLTSGAAKLLPIPAVEALARRHTSLKLETVPAGFYQTSPMVPAEDFQTVTLQAQLLANTDAPVRLVEVVTEIISDARFQRRNGLTELFAGGTSYATDRPEYEMHPGASHIYSPGLKPLLNPDFVEGTEGLRSFIVSLLAAAWLLHRWWNRRQIRSQEHRLDRYIRELLALERAQMEVDGEGGPEESKTLQELLDSVTILRQEALSEFTAHELNEDRAVDCFIEMCHALSDKINGKLTRHAILSTKSMPTSKLPNG